MKNWLEWNMSHFLDPHVVDLRNMKMFSCNACCISYAGHKVLFVQLTSHCNVL